MRKIAARLAQYGADLLEYRSSLGFHAYRFRRRLTGDEYEILEADRW